MKGKIDFVVVGYPKNGTTWLYDQLRLLPGFDLPPQKEIHFFDRDPKYKTASGLSRSSILERAKDGRWLYKAIFHPFLKLCKFDFAGFRFYRKWYYGNYSNEWYSSLFDNTRGITGDITPTYGMLDIDDLKEMRRVLPEDVKFIFIIRDPLDRAWSQFRMWIGRRAKRGGSETFTKEEIHRLISSERMQSRSDYIDSIRRYQEVFKDNEMMITFYDVLKEDPERFLKNIVTFLGGDSHEVETHAKLSNRSKVSPGFKTDEETRHFLFETYKHQLEELDTLFGGYCTKWNRFHKGKGEDEGIELIDFILYKNGNIIRS